MSKKYSTSIDARGNYYVDGPSVSGCMGYYCSNLKARFHTEGGAKQVAALCEEAYEMGFREAQARMRKALGLEKSK